jgi:hypothetical protein
MIRRAALDTLTVLRDLEEKSRLPLSDEAYDVQSDHGSGSSQGNAPGHSRGASPYSDNQPLPQEEFGGIQEVDPDTSVAFSIVKVHGRDESIMVWEDEDSIDFLSGLSDEEKRERWDERLVVGSGWLYKQDLRLEDLGKEREVVEKYLDTVDDVLFGGIKDGKRGWDRERERAEKKEKEKSRRASSGDSEGFLTEARSRKSRRIVSTGILEELQNLAITDEPDDTEEGFSEGDSIDDDELPVWAKRSSFPDDSLGTSFHCHLLLNALSYPNDKAEHTPSSAHSYHHISYHASLRPIHPTVPHSCERFPQVNYYV